MTTTTTPAKETTVTEPTPLTEQEADAARRYASELESSTGVSVDGQPLRDDDYTPEAIDRDQDETPTAIAAFLRAMVTEVSKTSGHETRRSVLRTMTEAGYPHLVRVAMGDLLTTVANYATDAEMVQALQRDTEEAFDASARRDAAAQDEAEERIYQRGGPNP